MPVISVILPTHNRERSLARAISSVLNQTFTDLELIVVDDASTDRSEDVVHAFTDPRLRYVRLKDNRGAAGARNVGIAAASCDWVAFQDSDDEWLPNKLEQQFSVACDAPPEVGLILSGYLADIGNRRIHVVPGHTLAGGDPVPDLLDGWPIITPTWLVRRRLLLELNGFDESYRCLEDWDLVLRLSAVCLLRAVPGPVLIKYSGGDASVCADPQHMYAALDRIIRKFGHHWAPYPRRLSMRLTHLACLLFRLGRRTEARAMFRRALAQNPWTPATHSLLCASYLGARPLGFMERLWPRFAGMTP
jgi:glycosyltransferase involved in cell wall biosynthesis